MKLAILFLTLVCLGCQPKHDADSPTYVRVSEFNKLDDKVNNLDKKVDGLHSVLVLPHETEEQLTAIESDLNKLMQVAVELCDHERRILTLLENMKSHPPANPCKK